MDKLISANSIIQKLIPVLVENGDMCLLGKIISIVYSEPAAFDKEKVMRRMKEIGKRFCVSVKCQEDCQNCEHGALMRALIKSIEKGGVE